MQQDKDRHKAEKKKVLCEVCWRENSKLASHFKEQGGDAVRLFFPKHDVSKDWTIEAAKIVIGNLKDESFEVKLWISVPRSPWCAWQRVSLWTIEGFKEKLQERREESLRLIDKAKQLVEETKCESDFEWPKKNDGWKQPRLEELMKSMPHFTVFDGCAYGLKNAEGKSMRKPWQVASTHGRIKDYLNKTCNCKGERAQVRGKRW